MLLCKSLNTKWLKGFCTILLWYNEASPELETHLKVCLILWWQLYHAINQTMMKFYLCIFTVSYIYIFNPLTTKWKTLHSWEIWSNYHTYLCNFNIS